MAHLGEVAHNDERLRSVGVSVLIVSQAKPALLAAHLRLAPQPFPVVSDSERTAYRFFGLARTGWLDFVRPSVLWGYLRLIFRGARIRRPYAGEDVRQLGGDFLLDRTGRIVFAYPSRTATDRPSIEVLIAAARAAGTAPP